jgi:hypothetical protein
MRNKHLIALGIIIITAIGIPVTVLLFNQQQELRSRASGTTPTPVPLVCPITPAQGRIIVNFPGSSLLSNSTAARSQSTPSTVSIPAGYYKTSLVTYDNHELKPSQAQPDESWFIKLKNSAGADVANSTPISDLPDNEEWRIEEVDQSLFIPQAVTSAIAVHAAYPNSNPNSLFPVCAAFDTIPPTPIPTSTPQPYPTSTPIATPTPVRTTFLLNGLLDGIGSRGDNTNPQGALSNKNPLHPVRNITISIYNHANQLILETSGTMTYSSESGSFRGELVLTEPIETGSYTIKAKTANHLTRLLPGIQFITAGTTKNLPDAIFIAGDVIPDNKLDILDYNSLIDCYSDIQPPTACDNIQKKDSSDLNDDGFVNHIDYNLFLREIATQPGE